MDPILGTEITDRYKLTEEEDRRINEIRSIYRTSVDRLASLEQKIQDCQRLMDGFFTEVKWRRSWGEAAVVAYDSSTNEVVCMEVKRHGQKEV